MTSLQFRWTFFSIAGILFATVLYFMLHTGINAGIEAAFSREMWETPVGFSCFLFISVGAGLLYTGFLCTPENLLEREPVCTNFDEVFEMCFEDKIAIGILIVMAVIGFLARRIEPSAFWFFSFMGLFVYLARMTAHAASFIAWDNVVDEYEEDDQKQLKPEWFWEKK